MKCFSNKNIFSITINMVQKSLILLLMCSDSLCHVLETGDSCNTLRYKYTIQVPNCLPKTITAKMCVGKCSSMTPPFRGAYCSRCYPSFQRIVTISLMCTFHGKINIRKIKYLKIRNCMCVRVKCVRWLPTDIHTKYKTLYV